MREGPREGGRDPGSEGGTQGGREGENNSFPFFLFFFANKEFTSVHSCEIYNILCMISISLPYFYEVASHMLFRSCSRHSTHTQTVHLPKC